MVTKLLSRRLKHHMIRRTAWLVAIALLASSEARASTITLASDPALFGSTLIDFDSEPTVNFVSRTISGVTFMAGPAFGDLLQIYPYDTGGISYGGTGQVLSTNAGPDAFSITFATPVSAFGMRWLGSTVDWNVSLYDASNTLIETLVWGAAPNPDPLFYGAKTNDNYVGLP